MNKAFKPKNDLPLMPIDDGIVLFHPHIPNSAIEEIAETLKTRWIGQGPKVEKFEINFKDKFHLKNMPAAVGSGTDALHLAYILSNICKGDEVLAPVFTCTATNIPLLYIGAKIKFIDVDPFTLNISVEDLKKKISRNTKAIVCVHYGGLPCDMNEINEIANHYKIPVIEDAAHALGAKYDGQYIGNISDITMFSFQAIKHITTGDGGLIAFKDPQKIDRCKRLRWFGIDRSQKQNGIWDNDILDIGFKYQMNDISAGMGIAGLNEFDFILDHRKKLFNQYVLELSGNDSVTIVNDNDPLKEHSAWLFTILVDRRATLQQKLREHGVESGQVHYRNDRYSIFNDSGKYPNMDQVDDRYLVLPLHTKVSTDDIKYICSIINSGW